MPIVEQRIDIALPQDEVYRISQDYSVRYQWDPFPEQLEMLGGGDYTARIGGQVRVRSKLGMTMVVEFVQVNPPHTAAIKMVGGPWYLAKFAGSWTFVALSENSTQVRFRYSIQAKGLLIKHVIDVLAVAYFSRATVKRLNGLRNYCNTLINHKEVTV